MSCGFGGNPDFAGAEHRASVPTVDATARTPTRKAKVIAQRSQASSIRALSAAAADAIVHSNHFIRLLQALEIDPVVVQKRGYHLNERIAAAVLHSEATA